jgi:hypothetical protein
MLGIQVRRSLRAMIHKKCSLGLIHVCLLLAVALTLAVPASAEWKEQVLYSFQGGTNDGALPVGGVVFGTKGNLYGVLQFYGPGSCGPIMSAERFSRWLRLCTRAIPGPRR